MSDTQLLRGISRIINDQNVKPDLNLEDLEMKMVQQGFIAKPQQSDKYGEELKKISTNLGLDLESFEQSGAISSGNNSGNSGNNSGNYAYNSGNNSGNSGNNSGNSPGSYSNSYAYNSGNNSGISGNSPGSYSNSYAYNSGNNSGDSDYSYNNNYTSGGDSYLVNYDYNTSSGNSGNNANSFTSRLREQKERPNFSYNISTEMTQRTSEQRRRQEIDEVKQDLGADNNNVWSIEQEKLEDQKTIMLEEIDSLTVSLEEDEVDISRIPRVTRDSSFEEVQTVHKILRIKNDRMRYCSFADEIILLGAYGLEELFNGDNTWFGRQPDLRGWHSNVQTKLRRMRHDTSSFVSAAMGEQQIGPFARILLELVPSAFMYSKMRKEAYGSKRMFSESSTARSIENIRGIKL